MSRPSHKLWDFNNPFFNLSQTPSTDSSFRPSFNSWIRVSLQLKTKLRPSDIFSRHPRPYDWLMNYHQTLSLRRIIKREWCSGGLHLLLYPREEELTREAYQQLPRKYISRKRHWAKASFASTWGRLEEPGYVSRLDYLWAGTLKKPLEEGLRLLKRTDVLKERSSKNKMLRKT